MEQAQKKNYWGFPGDFLGKEKIIKEMKIFLENLEFITHIPRWFSGGNLMRRVQNLIFLCPALMIDLGNQFKAVFACKKLS